MYSTSSGLKQPRFRLLSVKKVGAVKPKFPPFQRPRFPNRSQPPFRPKVKPSMQRIGRPNLSLPKFPKRNRSTLKRPQWFG